MADIIERAEDCLQYGPIRPPIIRDLIDALKTARAENERLRADAEMWRGVQNMYRRVGW